LQLIPIRQEGTSEVDPLLSELGQHVAQANCENYKKNGFQKPWCAYFALIDETVIGSCAFKTPIHNGAVEIAYFTFPDFEGKGYATQMARTLVEIAKSFGTSVLIKAQTLPEENASTKILRKLGFKKNGSVIHPKDGEVWDWEFG
jgi:RimJ/RimL family protein N-acetyltransferase